MAVFDSVTLQLIDGGDFEDTALDLFASQGANDIAALERTHSALNNSIRANNEHAIDEAGAHIKRLRASLPAYALSDRMLSGDEHHFELKNLKNQYASVT